MEHDSATHGLPQEVYSSIVKNALLNAIRHSGKAEPAAVVSKVIGEFPQHKDKSRAIAGAARAVVSDVNSLGTEEQSRMLSEKYPDAETGKKEAQKRVGLPPLPDAVKGHVVLRLPPEPSGFMHIGHAMAGVINHAYKEAYEGRLWLRFEDTNPRKVLPKYYESFREGYRWLGIEWDEEKCVSDDIETIYASIGKLLERGQAYACACDPAKVKKQRFEGVACEHRDRAPQESTAIWEDMLSGKFREGEYVIRLKGDMSDLDYSLRDPNIARIIDYSHPLTGNKFVVWPTYDFAVVVEDELCGVTHVLRSSEFHLSLQAYLRDLLSFRGLHVLQFTRFNFKGTPVQKRLLRPLVEKGVVSGWDDPRMPTIGGVQRRGIAGEAVKAFTLQVGYTKAEHTFDWSLLFAVNRKTLDPVAKRLFFVPRPVRLKVRGSSACRVTIPFHPDKDLGTRSIDIGDTFFVPTEDIQKARVGELVRLIDLYNVKIVSMGDASAEAEFAGEELKRDVAKLQWVTSENLQIRVMEFSTLFNEDGALNEGSLRATDGYVEAAFKTIKIGEVVQFPRYGFCRLDSEGVCVLAHR